MYMIQKSRGTSLAVQWLRLHAPKAGRLGPIPGQGAKIPHAATNTCCSQTNSFNSRKINNQKWHFFCLNGGKIRTGFLFVFLFVRFLPKWPLYSTLQLLELHALTKHTKCGTEIEATKCHSFDFFFSAFNLHVNIIRNFPLISFDKWN